MNFSLYKAFLVVYKLESNTKLTVLLSFGINEGTTRQIDHEYIVDDGT